MAFNIDNELKQIADNISIFTGKDKETEKILKHMGLQTSDISDGLRKDVKKVSSILINEKKDPKVRIDSAREIVSRLNDDKDVPIKIRKLILANAMKRLEDAEAPLRATRKISYDLNLFLSDDKDVQRKLRKMGIAEVPEIVKKVAKDAQGALNDKKLDARERAIKAADVLMEPLQPAITGDRSRKNILDLSDEIKSVLWEIANDFTYSAAKR